MALFKKKEKEEVAKEEVTPKVTKTETPSKKSSSAAKSSEQTAPSIELSTILKQPRITEKATFTAEKGVYVFEVNKAANKSDIASAVEHYYNVKPVKVNIAKIPSKKIASKVRGRFGTKPNGKKAYVYLKKGDTIEIA